MTLAEAEIFNGYNENDINYRFSGAGGVGIAYRPIHPLAIGLAYWRQIPGTVHNEDASVNTIEGWQHLTVGLEYTINYHNIPFRTFLTGRRNWIPDVRTIADRFQNQLTLGISGRYAHLGMYTSLSWFKDQYEEFKLPPPWS
jgi:hypothetical protein